MANDIRTPEDVFRTIESGDFYSDYDQSVSDLRILRECLTSTRAAPKVKPLVWVDEFGDGSQFVGSHGSLGYHARIQHRPSGEYHYMGFLSDSLDEVKGEVQKCFAASLLSALEGLE